MADFDPKADYEAAKITRIGGKAYGEGDAFDKESVPEDHLPILFTNGHIQKAGTFEAKQKAEQEDGGKGDGGEGDNPDRETELTVDQQARVNTLVADNDRLALDKLASSPEVGIAEPGKLSTKADVAEAIVRAQDAKQG